MTEFSDTTDAGSSHCVIDIFNPRNHLSENLAPKVALLKAIFHIDNTGRLTKPPPPKSFSDQVFEYILSGKVPLPPARKARKPTLVDGRVRRPIERGASQQAKAILGLPVRTVQDLAARGEIAGAAKLGRRWTFDLEKLRRFVRQRERETWQHANHPPDVSGAAKLFGAGPRFAGENSDGRFTRVTRRLRARNTTPRGSG
jgi:Helix-turn-helix domain